MWYVFGIIMVSIGITIYEVPNLLKKNSKKELVVFSILLILALALSIAEILYEDLPNPLDGITMIYKPVSDFLFDLLK